MRHHLTPNVQSSWFKPPHPLILSEDEVDVWRADLDLASQDLENLSRLLIPSEKEKGDRLYFVKDRQRYLAGRAILRSVLAKYTHEAPIKLNISQDNFGKPIISKEQAGFPLQFNLSHSENHLLIAVAHGLQVGIDIEKLRVDFAYERIANRFFTTKEAQMLRHAKPIDKQEIFFKLWTAKEAYLKAKGTGLRSSLDSVEIGMDEKKNLLHFEVKHHPEESWRWRLYSVEAAYDYIATLVVEATQCKVRCLDWDGV